ncbi:MAG: tetratricopeptide repeat protein [Candidatus Nealsonbacteria bacterium]|nr:tetratricopeptide repeat protein [Candidatus Nealsonbacteria bacterium]
MNLNIKTLRAPDLLDAAAKWGIYLAVFLTPLFFLPWTFNVLDFNKQILLFVLALVSLISFLVKGLILGRIEVHWSKLQLLVLAFAGLYGLSTIFSFWREGSFWGWPLNTSSAFLTLVSLAMIYFLVINTARKQEETLGLFFVFAISVFSAALIGVMQIFGKFVFPFDFARIASFNTIGTTNAWAVFLAASFPVTFVLGFAFRKLLRLAFAVFAAISLFALVLANFWVAWAVFAAGISLIYIFGILNIKTVKQPSLVYLPIALLVVALFFLFFKFSVPFLPQTSIEVSPSYSGELGIIKQAAKELGLPRLVFGTGPGTFVYNFSMFKSPTINQTVFWNTRFSSGASELLDRLITSGIFGFTALILIIFFSLKSGFSYLRKRAGVLEERLGWLLTLGIFSSFFATVVVFILYPASLSLTLLFWICLAGLGVFGEKEKKEWQMESSSYSSMVLSSILVLAIILGMGLSLVFFQKYAAQLSYVKGLNSAKAGNANEAVLAVRNSASLSPSTDVYWRDLSQLYLAYLNSVQGADQNTVQNLISGAIDSARLATEANPKDVANWSVRGFTYRNLFGSVGGAEDWAIQSYQKATELERTNPYLFTELGIAYAQKQDFDSAKKAFDKAIELKPDYAPAHFRLALLYDFQGKTDEAIAKLEQLKTQVPSDVGLAFQLGLIYYREEKLSLAQKELERALTLSPTYSNARYFLGLVLDKQGSKGKAISQFQEIEKYNPDNQLVAQIIANLKKGKSALSGISSQPQPPIQEEQPPERVKTK